MKTLVYSYLLLIFLFISFNGYSQSDCESIQCDCENIPDAEKDPGLVALCNFIEKSLKERCEKGETNLQCKEGASGPNAWTKPKSFNQLDADAPDVRDMSEIKYCNQLMAFARKNGYLFGNIRVSDDVMKKGYFKEAWAYDINNKIYVIVVMSKKEKSGYAYSLSKTSNTMGEYQFYVYCNVKKSDWREFSTPCKGCDYDERFTEFIQKNECDCL